MVDSMIVFLSNVASPHSIPLCKAIIDIGIELLFIETSKLIKARSGMGYEAFSNYDFVVSADKFYKNEAYYTEIIDKADVLLFSFGSVSEKYLTKRIQNNLPVYLLSERLFKKGFLKLFDPKLWKSIKFFHSVYDKNVFLLCMGSYVPDDFRMCGFNQNKIFKFGYITECKLYDEIELLNQKNHENMNLLWVGRLIWWKQPLQAIKCAKLLEDAHYNFELHIIGDGPLKKRLERYVLKHKIRNIVLHGSMNNHDVKKRMIESDILLCTSNRLEGWGAVINEGMSLGCTVVANRCMGATNWLIRNNHTGIIYSGGYRQLYKSVISCLPLSKTHRIGINGYCFIRDYWSPSFAAERLVSLISNNNEYRINDGAICSMLYMKQ